MEPVSVAAIILSILAGVGALLARFKFKHCRMCCIDSDCVGTPGNTPRPSTSTINYQIPSTVVSNNDFDIYSQTSDYV